MAEQLLDLLEAVCAGMGRTSPPVAARRIRAAIDAEPGDTRGFTVHRWFAMQRHVAASASERRFLDEVEAILLWGPFEAGGADPARRPRQDAGAPAYRPTA
jgi:hypothetical protein